MNRLTEFDEEKNIFIADIYDTEYIDWGEPALDTEKVNKIVQKLGYYEQKAENGLLLELPCKEGDFVYKIVSQRANYDDSIYYIVCATSFRLEDIKNIGKTIFLTKEQANEKLKEMKK